VLVVTNPPALPFIAAIACGIKNTRYTVLMFDLYPTFLLQQNTLDKNPITRVVSLDDEYSFPSFQNIIVLGGIWPGFFKRDIRVLTQRNDHPELGMSMLFPRRAQTRIRLSVNYHSKRNSLFSMPEYRTDTQCGLLLECAEMLREDMDICFLFMGMVQRRIGSWKK